MAPVAVRAYQLSAAMQGFLTGKPATAPGPAGKAEGEGELGFTWESKDPLEAEKPFENDTSLMRPGE